jgi:hypothetical protein
MIWGQNREVGMSRKQFTTEKIIGMLREADVALAQGMKVGRPGGRCFHVDSFCFCHLSNGGLNYTDLRGDALIIPAAFRQGSRTQPWIFIPSLPPKTMN